MAKSTPVSAAASIEFEDECVAFFAEIVQLFGLPRSVGQIYGLIYISPEPLGFSAIVERLEMSKGSASQGLQLLRSLGAINESDISSTLTGELGSSRRVAYEPGLSLRQLVAGIISERITPSARAGADRLKGLKRLAEQSPTHAEFYLDRVNQLATWRKQLTTVLPLLSALLGPNKKKKR